MWRGHPSLIAIGLLNLLLGWTFLGWLGSLVWSLILPQNPIVVHIPVWMAGTTPALGVSARVPTTIYQDGRRKPVFAAADTMACPSCAETIKAAAVRCRFWGHVLTSGSTRGVHLPG